MRRAAEHLVIVALAAAVIVAGADARAAQEDPAMAHPDWSPDGRLLVFEARWDGHPNIWLMELDGGDPRQLTVGAAMDSYPRFAPDGRSIVYLRRDDAGFSMHLIGTDGSGGRDLLGDEANLEPAFAPDGERVAFRSYLAGADRDGEILIVDLTTGATVQVTDNDVEDGFPSFLPDGSGLLFHRAIDGHRQVMRIDLESGRETQLTAGDFDSWHAHASPDGRRVVFDSERFGSRDIFLMELESGAVRRLTDDPGREGYPKFSPDGSRVVFHSSRSGSSRIQVLDLTTGATIRVLPPGR